MSLQKSTIAIITHAGGSPYHGPNMRVYFMAKNFVEQGHTVYIIGCGVFHKYYNPPELTGRFTHKVVDGINYVWVSAPQYNSKSLKRLLNQALFTTNLYFGLNELKIEAPDFIIASSPHPFVIYPARRLAKRHGSKLIFEIRDLWPLGVIEFGGMHARHPYIKLLEITEKYSYKHADLIVSVKPGDLDYIREHYPKTPEHKLRYIPNGFDTKNVHIAPLENDDLRQKLEGKFVIGYAGALTVAYAIDVLCTAAGLLKDRYPDLRIVLVGGGSDAERIAQRVQEEQLTNVLMTGFVEKKFVLSHLELFDVCYIGLKQTLASKHGISSNKLFDYMYAAKPVLAAYVTDHDPVTLADGGICVYPDGEAVAKAIEFFMEKSESELEIMGSRNKEYLDQHHTYGIIAGQFLELFEELASSAKSLS